MARDRKRAKQRRERQERAGGAQARRAEAGADALPRDGRTHDHDSAEHASGEVDLAEAQLALGRPELADAERNGGEEPLGGSATDEVLEAAFDDDGQDVDFDTPVERGEDELDARADDALTPSTRTAREPRAPAREDGSRLAVFLRGSWRELERVQWPDRRQVAQATAVVIGFVIIAGAFLGLMDLVASRLVDVIV